MRFQYCPDCGTQLVPRPIGDEGLVPWCETCGKPLFDMFSTCVIVLVVNEKEEALLLRQSYLSDRYHNLVSGYMKPGETAESCAAREVEEETGIAVDSLQIQGTWWFGKKDMLMIGFVARAKKGEFTLSSEVDAARWVPMEEAQGLVHPQGSVSYALIELYRSKQ